MVILLRTVYLKKKTLLLNSRIDRLTRGPLEALDASFDLFSAYLI